MQTGKKNKIMLPGQGWRSSGPNFHNFYGPTVARQRDPLLIAVFTVFVVLVSAFSIFTKELDGKNNQSSDVRVRPGSVFQVGAYVGGADTRGDKLKITGARGNSFTVRGLEWEGKSFKAPIYYGIRTIYWRPAFRLFGVMLDFTHIKAIALKDKTVRFEERDGSAVRVVEAPLKEQFNRVQFSHGHNLLTLNGVFGVPILNGWLRPYAGLGAGAALPHVEIRRKGDSRDEWTYEYQVTGPVLQALVGVEVRLTDRISMFFEYKLNYANIDARLKTGERLQTRLFTHQGLSGVAVAPVVVGP